jgi:hypothetical protein
MTTTLRLTRRWGSVTDRGKWQILIDGAGVGSIAKSETVEIPIEPGRHTLRVKRSERFLSKERSFEADEDDIVSFRCRSLTLWPTYLAALVKPDLWISLRQN